jgi:hypothetical protein
VSLTWTIGMSDMDNEKEVIVLDEGVARSVDAAARQAAQALRFLTAIEGRRDYNVVVGEQLVLITPGLTTDGRVDLDGLDESLAEFLATR